MADMYILPQIRTRSDCEREFPDILTIHNFQTYDMFDDLYWKVYYAICACVEIKECMSYKIRFKFYPEDEVVYSLSMSKFLMNLNAWRPLVELNRIQSKYRTQIRVMDASFIVSAMMSDSLRMALESKVLKVLNEYGIPFETSSQLLKTMIERYQEISVEFAMISHASIMTYESIFLNDYRSSEKIRELNNIQISQEIQTSDLEELLRQKTAELFAEFEKTKNPLMYILKAGQHVKIKQLQELYISYGQIPDAMGNIIPYTMQGNGFSTGYKDPASYYIAGTGALLSAIVNKMHMGDAGYLTRNLELLARTLTLSTSVFDCGTKHLVKLKVIDSTFLHRLENKWYKEFEGEPLRMIHYADCKHLIGKTIYVRSLITCACVNENECCSVCYGGDAHLIANMPGMAIYNTQVYAEPVTQNLLSTKHLMFTVANRIFFSESFNKYFKYNSGDIYLRDKDEWDENTNVGHLFVRIEQDNMIAVNQQDLIDINAFGNHVESPFYVYDSSTDTYDRIDIQNYENLFIDYESMKSFKLVGGKKSEGGKKYFEISFAALSADLEGRLMSITIKNNGLTDNLYNIMRLIDKEAGKYDTYDEIAQNFFELLITSGIKCRNVQAEVILNRLVRDANDLYHRPDFKQFKLPEYKIVRLNQALLKNPSATIGTSYQELKRQITTDELYDVKDGKAFMDALYRDKIPTKRLKNLVEEYRKKKEAQNGRKCSEDS